MKKLRLQSATEHDLDTITGLIDDVVVWLQDKRTDQWAKPWPTRQGRDERILQGLRAGKTWIVWDSNTPAATITVDWEANPKLWSEFQAKEPAVYLHRLIVSRQYAGQGLGADLIDWAACRAREGCGARWVRVDVWATNTDLHDYYKRQGFMFVRLCAEEPDYPGGALFQRATDSVATAADRCFEEEYSPQGPLVTRTPPARRSLNTLRKHPPHMAP